MPLRPSPEKKEEKERTRSALLRAALRLGSAHGFSSVGLREVARAAGIAPTSFYRHFADMQELGLALAEELVGPLLRCVPTAGARPSRPFPAAILAVIDALLESAAADSELTRFMLAELAGCSPRLRAALRAHVSELAARLRALSADAGAEHAIPHALAEAAAVLLLDGCLRELEAGQGVRASVRETLALALRPLLAPSTPGSAP